MEYARRAGITVVRTGAVYVAAKRAGLVDSVRVRLEALRAAGFWLREDDCHAILNAAAEP